MVWLHSAILTMSCEDSYMHIMIFIVSKGFAAVT